MNDFEPIPSFLLRQRTSTTQPAIHIRARKPDPWSRPKPPRGWPKGMPVPKTVTPEALALAREIDRREKEKAKARFAALKQRSRS